MKQDERFVAYVSTYTMKDNKGIKIYDVDMKNGLFNLKGEVEITNSSYITVSHSKKYLYAITDFGVESFKIEPDGFLTQINIASINGMRGCYLSTDFKDEFLFVAGYHDGKITVLRVNEDGSVGAISDELYLKGLGSVADRNFRPHVNCVKMTRDNKYLLAADPGMDHVNVYKLDRATGKLSLVDIIRSEIESAPRHICFSKDGNFAYIVHEIKNYIDVYSYVDNDGDPEFEKIQTVSTLNDYHASNSAACTIRFSYDYSYLVSSNAGDNSAIVFKVDQKTGLLEKMKCLPISGDYPKDAALFPDNKHLLALNNESNTITFFNFNEENGLIALSAKPLKVSSPNCIAFFKLK
ncbi:MAG: lactonase family protein [Lachnospiraceae bacterium]|nr:lactonase family protein [Candidatus Merdinaster equi]